jgi:hypothetical protein
MTRRDEAVEFPPPDTTIEEYGSNPTLRLPENGAVAPYPLHWVGAAWYVPFVEFAGRSRNGDASSPQRAVLKYRCTLEGCNQLFETEGAPINNALGAAEGPVSLRTMGNGESIEAHMERAHGLKHLPARRFATSLLGCCGDPMTAATCWCAFLPAVASWDVGLSPCFAVQRVFTGTATLPDMALEEPVPARGRTSVHATPDALRCIGTS